MQRGTTGTYTATAVAGETVRAFVPAPLPPTPAIELTGARQRLLERALLACGRLDAITALLPEPDLFLYAYVRREAVLSSQIEGTQSSLSDLLMFELDQAPGVPFDDVTEVSNYVAALEHGLARLREGFPLCNRLLREIHARLLASGRGATKQPGEFRTSQNWLGGTRPGNAQFVPPPPQEVEPCMGALERYLHAPDAPGALVKAALAHVQFETIHPFLDGNGRIGRLLVPLYLVSNGLLAKPSLYLSDFFERNRASYYDALMRVRVSNDMIHWVRFFLQGVAETATKGRNVFKEILALRTDAEHKLLSLGKRAPNAKQALNLLYRRPMLSATDLEHGLGVSHPTANALLRDFIRLGILREITGAARHRLYVFETYLELFTR